MALIQVSNLSFQYAGSTKKSLDDITFTIDRGEFILLIGPTGCGKTSLCRCLNGLIPHFYQGRLAGDVIVNGLNTKETEVYDLATIVGLVFQNPENQLVSLNVERELAFAPENLGLPREEIKSRVEEALELLHLGEIRKKPPFELSGGEQQRVAIGSVLTLKPSVLMLDEPTANLDPKHAIEILQLLIDLHHRKNITILVVEHRLDLIAKHASRVILMDNGSIRLDGPPIQVFQNPMAASLGVSVPRITQLFLQLQKKGYSLDQVPIDVDAALDIFFPQRRSK
ncbi:MAG: energy-coupling factor ABC transporter ATP-binding protein [Candidatus Ranarchaeia archaeon]